MTYLPFVLGSFLFILVGGVLLFAPDKFIAAGHWWGRKIGFPEAQYQSRTDRSFTWRNWRLPGLYGFCFGLVMLFVIVRSLIREELRVSPTSDAIPILLGVYILLCTEKILAKVKNSTPEHVGDRLNPIRFLIKAIGSLAIVAGLVFLFRHLFSF